MESIYRFNYNISDLLRDTYKIEECDLVVAKYYLLGFCYELNNIELLNKDVILRSSDIRDQIERAFDLIEKEFPQLNGVFSYLDNDYKMSDRTRYQLLSMITSVNFSKEQWGYAFQDMLFRIYETVGRDREEHTTPQCLNKLGIQLLEPNKGSFYDGTSGLNGTLIEAYAFANEGGSHLELYGQEINSVVWAIGKIRLFMNEIEDANIQLGNTLKAPLFNEGGNQIKRFDTIMMNFPFGLSWNTVASSVEQDTYNRFIFGKPAKSSSEWLFISHIIKSLKEQGKAIAITTSGTLFGSGGAMVRENILVADCIEAVIALPPALFTTTSIPVNMVVINMKKDEELKNKILFINAENMYEIGKRNQKILTEEHIAKIVDIYKNKKVVEEFSVIVNREELEENNLLPNRYLINTEINVDYFGRMKFDKDRLRKLAESTTLGEIGELYRGINLIGENTQDDNGEYKIINLADVKDGKVDIDVLNRYTIKNNARVEAYMVQEGDIIISSRGVSTKICIIPKHEGKVLLSQNFIGIRLKIGNSPEYIKEFLESPLGQFLIGSKQAGTSVITLNPKDLKQIPIELLPLEKQFNIMKDYKKQDMELRNEIEQLQGKIKELKLELYEKMGIRNTFKIL